jgi:inhibitor of KinA
MRLSPLGDRALLVHVGDAIDEPTLRRVRAVCARLEARRIPGVIELVPAFATVAVHYDPRRIPAGAGVVEPVVLGEGPYHRLVALVTAALEDLADADVPAPQMVEIPVLYGGDDGPDLDDVARHHALSPDEVVRIHTGGDYLVYMLGFAPGFAYLGGLSPRIATPRRAEPRTAVPAGSVAIGGSQTGVYPLVSPGGWQIIGRTPLRLFDLARTPPARLAVGDRVRFRAITANELASARDESAA